MKALNGPQVKAMLLYVADQIIGSKPMLTEVDSAIGDGDHGIGMARGMEAVKSAVEITPEDRKPYELFRLTGQTMLMSMGGASGVIFGSMFLGGAKCAQPKDTLNGTDFAELFRKGLDAVQQRGGAVPGDKTMVDALAPAVEALEMNADAGLEAQFAAAEGAAQAGMNATKGYVAKFGRAKSLLDRAVGYQDAGATSVWLIFKAMHEWVLKEERN